MKLYCRNCRNILQLKRISELKSKIKKYNEKKAKINKKYSELMILDKMKFGLKEIDDKNFKDINNIFTAGGSNKPIATVMWYINLLKLKNEFNPNAIKFPLVLDSPNNAESDYEKKKALLNYIFAEVNSDTQVIVSTLGFNISDYKDAEINNIIELKNNRYELLNKDDYKENIKFLYMFLKK